MDRKELLTPGSVWRKFNGDHVVIHKISRDADGREIVHFFYADEYEDCAYQPGDTDYSRSLTGFLGEVDAARLRVPPEQKERFMPVWVLRSASDGGIVVALVDDETASRSLMDYAKKEMEGFTGLMRLSEAIFREGLEGHHEPRID